MLVKSFYKKSVFFASIFSLVALPSKFVLARSDLDLVWSNHYSAKTPIFPAIDLSAMGDLAIFLVYIAVFSTAGMAVISMFVGYLKMYLASGNQDNEDKGQHRLVAGFVSLVLSLLVFFSLGSVVELVKELASNLA